MAIEPAINVESNSIVPAQRRHRREGPVNTA
jgi:hypothetical protein